MMELQVTLDFACCDCEEPVSVTVNARARGWPARPRTVAAVNVPVPDLRQHQPTVLRAERHGSRVVLLPTPAYASGAVAELNRRGSRRSCRTPATYVETGSNHGPETNRQRDDPEARPALRLRSWPASSSTA